MNCKIVDPEDHTPGENPSKRKPPGNPDQGTPPKKQKVEPLATPIIEAQSIDAVLLCEAKMLGKDSPMLQIRANHATYIVNSKGP